MTLTSDDVRKAMAEAGAAAEPAGAMNNNGRRVYPGHLT